MAGAKKKKKPAVNPARGFATTSIASKPRPEIIDESNASSNPSLASVPGTSDGAAPQADKSGNQSLPKDTASQKDSLTAEEFEKQLEESDLQLFVEKYSQKVKRDAQRQRTRLQTDRRLLRSSADPINSIKWLPQDLMDQTINLIKAESRFAVSSLSSEYAGQGKMPSEEDMVARLWTLLQTLTSVDFPEQHVESVIKYVLDISPTILTTSKDLVWGLEEALEWLARECTAEELPAYESRPKPAQRDTSADKPSASQIPNSRDRQPQGDSRTQADATELPRRSLAASQKTVITCDEDFEPDRLIPEYLAAKRRLVEIERKYSPLSGTNEAETDKCLDPDIATAQLQAKLKRIESDVLFDKFLADQQWRAQKIALEKEISNAKREAMKLENPEPDALPETEKTQTINDEADRIAAEILAEGNDDDDDISGLFASLPQNEVDPLTGKTQTVLNSADGTKTIIKDFGKWSGVAPRRVLEEACRSRDASVKINYRVVSDATFASRHAVDISWTKAQNIPQATLAENVEVVADPTHFTITMIGVAAPDAKQSEAYVATFALFCIFSGNSKEEKVGLKLPPVWRDLWMELSDTKRSQLDAEDRTVVKDLRHLVRQRQDQELEDGVILASAFRGRGSAKNSQDAPEHKAQDRAKQSNGSAELYRQIWADKAKTSRFQTMLRSRMKLPMWQFKDEVLRTVDQNQVVIVCGETGCGKSTQVPAFLLEHELSQGKACKIYCTEPRRISAISLARRVSEELGETKADLGTNRSLIGYAIRLESNTSKETRLVYATTGIVMRMLEGSKDLHEVTHLVLDEVHERSIDSDFLLIVLKRLLKQRRNLKVVLMSATVDAERFSSYLGGAPVLNVPGRTFPVQVKYLEDAIELTGYTPANSRPDKMIDLDEEDLESEGDGAASDISKSLSKYPQTTRSTLAQLDEYQIEFDLIVQLIAHIAGPGPLEAYSKAILVFLPGIAEIRTLNDYLLGDPRFSSTWLVYPLHSTIATEDQEAAFLVPPQGMRKIVLATNIAETGITIPDVTCVIDTGKHREMRYDERRQLSRLVDTFISRANAKQRRGRAGRVQEGLCFHMFTRYRHDALLSDQQTPEMLRLSLQDLAIRVKICKIGGIEETLGDALDPPTTKNIRRAIDALIDVRALTMAEDLTPLGHQLARLPLDVFLGKLILLGSVFKCLDMALTVAAILSSKSPFTAPFGQRAQAHNAKMLFRRGDSDLLTIYNAYLAWKRVCQSNGGLGKEFQFCRKNFLSQQTLANIEDLKGQLLTSLADSGFLACTEEERRMLSRLRYASAGRRRQQNFFDVPQRMNINSDNDLVSASVIAWSFYPKLLVRDTPGTRGLRNIGNNQSISLHPSSVNRGQLDLKWLSYYHIMQAKTVYHAHETTSVDSFAIALLCGDVRCDMYSGVIILDGNRGRFSVPDWKTMLVIKVLRTRLREILTRSFKQPGKLPTTQHEKWFNVWQKLFSQEANEEKSTATLTR